MRLLLIWVIVCLQAIETFAVTVKEIAQLLQSFGSELSETELPDEASAIEFLLHSHTHRYRQMKVVTGFVPFPSSFISLSLSFCFFFLQFAQILCFILSGRHPERTERRTPAAVQPGNRQGL